MSKLTDEIVASYMAKQMTTFILKVDMNPKSDSDEVAEEIESTAVGVSAKIKMPEKIIHQEGVYYCILKPAGRREIGLAMTAGKDPISMGQSIIKNCWLDGDEEIKDLNFEDTVGVVAAMQAIELMSVGQGSLKKL